MLKQVQKLKAQNCVEKMGKKMFFLLVLFKYFATKVLITL